MLSPLHDHQMLVLYSGPWPSVKFYCGPLEDLSCEESWQLSFLQCPLVSLKQLRMMQAPKLLKAVWGLIGHGTYNVSLFLPLQACFQYSELKQLDWRLFILINISVSPVLKMLWRNFKSAWHPSGPTWFFGCCGTPRAEPTTAKDKSWTLIRDQYCTINSWLVWKGAQRYRDQIKKKKKTSTIIYPCVWDFGSLPLWLFTLITSFFLIIPIPVFSSCSFKHFTY